MSNQAAAGVTLLELLIALVIAGVVLTLALPTWGGWFAEQALRDRAEALLHTLDRARSEAVKRGHRVDVCPESAGDCPGAAASWEGGWKIVVPATPGSDVAALAVAREPRAAPGVTIRGNRPVADYVSYTSLGHARRADGSLQMGTFVICQRGHKARKVILANSGRARIEQTAEDCP